MTINSLDSDSRLHGDSYHLQHYSNRNEAVPVISAEGYTINVEIFRNQ